MTIKQALIFGYGKLQAKKIHSAQLDAEILLSFVIKKPREFVLAYPEKRLTSAQAKKYSSLIIRRSKYEPVAYMTGEKEFYRLKFKVNKKALIPHPETELLVEFVLDMAQNLKQLKIIDIGCGSGAIALALKKHLPKAKILALDNSPAALALARQNAQKLGLKVDFLKSDLLAKVPVKWLSGAILAVNLPYVDPDEIKNFSKEERAVLKYEPANAIFAGASGTAVYHKLFRQLSALPEKAYPKLMIAEIGSFHYKEFLALIKKYFSQNKIDTKYDYAGRPRFLIINF